MAGKKSRTKTESLVDLNGIECIVVKVGSGVISGKGKLRPKAIADLAHDITVLVHRGFRVVLVASGAIAAGHAALGLTRPPTNVIRRQASACVGQYRLMTTLAKAFNKHRIQVAQLLMMEDDIENRRRFLSARHALQFLLDKGVVPVINENDPLADEQATLGDNDHLAAMVTNVVSAQLLIILSTVPGVLDQDTDEVIREVRVGSAIERHVTGSVSVTGVGGMGAKIRAAQIASRGGVPTIIADGGVPGLLQRIVGGEAHGTLFVPQANKLSARKRWIVFRTKSRGTIRVDDGAKKALLERGASLLPSGVTGVDGRFAMGARVDVNDASNATVAQGLVSYSSEEIERMRGRKRSEFKKVLGYEYVDEIIHRGDMVVWCDGEVRP